MKGRGTDKNYSNPYLSNHYDFENEEDIDEKKYSDKIPTTYITEFPKSILSKNDSPDVPFTYSINPYQGCEHGCVYCYARNSHQYWGLGSGLDFESKIIVKKNAPALLEKAFLLPRWKVQTVALSGNTDCYQPAERKFKITRELLKVFLKFGNPVGIITKNSLVSRDQDLLSDLARENLVKVYFTITSLDNKLRSLMEPRTSTAKSKFETIEILSNLNIPTGVMVGPIIPGLTDHEIGPILKSASNAGALEASYTMVRLNGQLSGFFENWLDKNYPDRKGKVLNKIKEAHNGHLNDNKWGRRMKGEGKISEVISSIFKHHKSMYFEGKNSKSLSLDRFRKNGNYSLF